MSMLIGIPREVRELERRVALTPATASALIDLGFSVVVEAGAGTHAQIPDEAYASAGVSVVDGPAAIWRDADVVLKVREPGPHPTLGVHEADLLKPGATLIGFIWPAQNPDLLERLSERDATVIAMDAIPRISRAQKCDALSAMANIAGYRAVVEAAARFPRFLGGQTTAAGAVSPAKVLVIGAGVAGLAAVGAASRMGAIVRAFDTRPEVRQQVESFGAEFLEVDMHEDGAGSGGYARVMSEAFIEAEMALFAEQARDVDIIITTALIPGQAAPRLITRDMVMSMREGSVIVDLAAEQGGNCELTEPDTVVNARGVAVVGFTDLPSRMATQSSELYANNLYRLVEELTPERNGELSVDMQDEMVRGATVARSGEVTWPPPTTTRPPTPTTAAAPVEPVPADASSRMSDGLRSVITMLLGGALLYGIGAHAPPSFMVHFTVFVLACFVGWQVIWNVTPALHTPLMSVTNAISGIVILGPVLMLSSASPAVVMLASAAVAIAAVNIAGGFVITQRMLQMFRRD